jgi:NAD(P) transhydrogenase subunit alpha
MYMEFILNLFTDHISMIYFIVLSVFVGVEVIGHVPTVLHTPLMSGVVIVGAIYVMLNVDVTDYVSLSLGTLAVLLGTLNVVGGFVVTDRMLEMFKKK